MNIECMGCVAGAAADLIEKLTDRCARYAEEIAVLQARQKWISVTERLPEDSDDVLAVVYGRPMQNIELIGALHIAAYCGDDASWYVPEYPDWGDPQVTHWMPLPEAPEVQQPEGHADPIGALGCLPFCPICGSRDMQWDPETDVSTCGHCGYQDAEAARRNREKRARNGEITR